MANADDNDNYRSFPLRAATTVHRAFDELPAHAKPQIGPARREWVPLAGVVLTRGAAMKCIAVA